MRVLAVVTCFMLLAGCLTDGSTGKGGGGDGAHDDATMADLPGPDTDTSSTAATNESFASAPASPTLWNVSIDALLDDRVTFSPSAGTWQAGRLTLPQSFILENDGSFDIVLAVDAPADSQPYLFFGMWLPLPDQETPAVVMPVALATGDGGLTLGVQGEGMPDGLDVQLMFIFGSNVAPASLSLGLFSVAPTPESAAFAAVRERDDIPIVPDHIGDSGFAGTYARMSGDDGQSVEWQHGTAQVERQAVFDGPLGVTVGETLYVHDAQQLATAGTGIVAAASFETAGVQEWSYDLRLPPHHAIAQGTSANFGPVHPSMVVETPFRSMGVLMQAHTEPGAFQADFHRNTTGKSGYTGIEDVDSEVPMSSVVVATWGWFDNDVASMYGWHWVDFVPGPENGILPVPPTPLTPLPLSVTMR